MFQAIGGLVVAVVVRYADNILKGFAASFSIVTSCLLCMILVPADFHPTALFGIGAVLVNYSMYMYSWPAQPQAPAASIHLSLASSRVDDIDEDLNGEDVKKGSIFNADSIEKV